MLNAMLLLATLTSFNIKKVDAPIVIDGDISDSAWNRALRIDDFVEFLKGDNTAPPVRTSAWLAYDERYLYVAFRNDDPKPGAIRAPFGDRVDYMNARIGRGGSFTLTSSIRPTTHLEMAASVNHEWLNVGPGQLYAADIDRLKATYVFNARSLARFVVQHSNVDRTAWLYNEVVSPRDGDLTLSVLYGYRINWQTTFFIGYGDFRLLDETSRLMPNQRSVFMKASYAFQR